MAKKLSAPKPESPPAEPENRTDIKKDLTFSQTERAAKKQAFLDNFKDYGTIYHTGRSIGVPHTTIIRWLNEDAAFGESFKSIKMIPGYMIERSALTRAMDTKNQADVLRIFMLKNLLPDSYGEVERHELEITIKDVVVTNFIAIVQQAVPDTCPHCKTNLGLQAKVVSELMALSERMLKTGGSISAADPRA
jgi:hypothetical protein